MAVGKTHREAERLLQFKTCSTLDTDLKGFSKTVANNPKPKSKTEEVVTSSSMARHAVPVFDPKYYESYDMLVAFPAQVTGSKLLGKDGDSVVPPKKREKIILSILRGRRVGKKINKIDSLKEFYGIRESDVSKSDLTYNQLLKLLTDAWRRTLDYGGIIYEESVSADKKYTIFCLKMSEDSLKRIADVKHYPLQMDPKVTNFDQFKSDPDFQPPYAPYEKKYEKTEREGSAMQTLGYIWQRYDRMSRPYNLNDVQRHDRELSCFRDVDRIRIMNMFFEGFYSLHWADKYDMVYKFFPLHQPNALLSLRDTWGNFLRIWTWEQPLNDIRDYYGEEVALYYAWMTEFCKALTIPAVFGLGLWACELVLDWNMTYDSKILNALRMVYCLILATWSGFVYKKWIRRENDLKLKWGLEVVTGNKVSPQANPWHKPNCMTADPVQPSKKRDNTSTYQLVSRKVLSTSVVALITIFCLLIVNREGSFALAKMMKLIHMDARSVEQFIADQLKKITSESWARKLAKNVFLVFIPLVLTVKTISFFWDRVIIFLLARFENNPFYVKYKKSITEKSFVFKFLINLVPVLYYAFVKEHFVEACDDLGEEDGRCILQARELVITLIVGTLSMNAFEILKPICIHAFKMHRSKKASDGQTLNYHEKQLNLDTYGERATIKDFQEMMLNYAFVALFGSVFPMLPAMAFLSAMIEIRCDAFKLTRAYQRTTPNMIEDTGVWKPVMNAITLGAALTNTLLVGFVTIGYNLEPAVKLTTAIGALITVICFKEFISLQIPAESKQYKTQKARAHVVMFEAIWGHSSAAKKSVPIGV